MIKEKYLIISIVLTIVLLAGCSKDDTPGIYKDSFWDYEKSKNEAEELVKAAADKPKEPISIKVSNINYEKVISYNSPRYIAFHMDIETNLPKGTEINFEVKNEEGDVILDGFSVIDKDGTDTVDMHYSNSSVPSGTYNIDANMLVLSFKDAEYDLWDIYGNAESAEKYVGDNGTVISTDDEDYYIYLWDIAEIEYPNPNEQEDEIIEIESEDSYYVNYDTTTGGEQLTSETIINGFKKTGTPSEGLKNRDYYLDYVNQINAYFDTLPGGDGSSYGSLPYAVASFELFDAVLNEMWSLLKAELDAETFAKLKEEQLEWINYKEQAAEAEAEAEGDYAWPTVWYNSYSAQFTEERIIELANTYMQ